MKLSTILNAYGKAMALDGKYAYVFSGYSNLSERGMAYYSNETKKKTRQAEKFKARLLRVIKLHDGECSFSFTDAYYEDDLRHCCLECGGEMQIVRPGKWQCPKCE